MGASEALGILPAVEGEAEAERRHTEGPWPTYGFSRGSPFFNILYSSLLKSFLVIKYGI